ncbi:MAG: hypothetical protein UHS47_11365, partial [Oscillospiraceae bacterium]|nr:hypothetical protein [Oscillospiraceae bacterium]
LYTLPRSLREFFCSVILRMVLVNPGASRYCSALDRDLDYRIDPKAYNNKISIEFEGEFFAAPEEYDYILTTIYGDYMTPPPENERFFGHEGSHGKIIYDHTTDYRVYRNKIEDAQ